MSQNSKQGQLYEFQHSLLYERNFQRLFYTSVVFTWNSSATTTIDDYDYPGITAGYSGAFRAVYDYGTITDTTSDSSISNNQDGTWHDFQSSSYLEINGHHINSFNTSRLTKLELIGPVWGTWTIHSGDSEYDAILNKLYTPGSYSEVELAPGATFSQQTPLPPAGEYSVAVFWLYKQYADLTWPAYVGAGANG